MACRKLKVRPEVQPNVRTVSENTLAENGQKLIRTFELALAKNDHEEARQALRRFLFAARSLPCEGSLGDAIASVAEHPSDQGMAAALVLRALSVPGVIRTNTANNIARFAVELIEGAMPDLPDLVGLLPKMQNFQKFAALERVHGAIRFGHSTAQSIPCWPRRPPS
jgi:hypothetical protein